MMRGLAASLLALALVGLVVPRSARAAPPDAAAASPEERSRARALFDEGKTHYDLGEYPQAIARFKEGYRISQSPVFLFNIAQSYRLMGECAEAARFYRNYLRTGAEADPAPIEARLAEMDACVRDAAPPTAPAAPQAVTQPVARVEDRGGGLRVAGLVGAGVGVLLVGAGLYTARRAGAERDDVAADCQPESPCDWPAASARLDDADASVTRATIFTVTGGVLVAGGLVVWLVGRARRETPVMPTVDVTRRPGGAVICLGWAL